MYQIDEKWTPAQRDAILSRGETLLVSAAAGSGKTAVLTERILSRVLDDSDALDLSSVLVVTFTKAAASELKARIRSALEGALAKQPGNRRLHTQLLSVGRAKICTIDSFCLDLIRSHFDDLGLSPRVSVADEAAAKLLAKTVMDTLIEDCFEGEEDAPVIESFGAFCDLYASSRNASALADVFLGIRETLNGYTEGVDWLISQKDRMLSAAAGDFLASDAGGRLLSDLRAFAKTWLARYEDMCAYLASDAVYLKNYGDCFSYEKEWLQELIHLLDTSPDYDAVRAHFQRFAAPGLKSGIRGDKKTEEIVRAKAQHDTFNARREGYLTRFFTVTSTELSALLMRQAEVIGKLHTFLSMYEDRLAREKNRRGQLDFGDMGRLALRLLWDGEKNLPTDTARAEAMKYSEIYIDEYQDVSPVQDCIFRAIAREDNRFMVGDAKQSIYGFRGASPALFLGYRAAFENDCALGRTIFLSDNFRCDEQVIDFSNLVFSVLFGCGATALPYTDDDALRYAKKTEGQTPQTQVTLALLSSDKEEPEDGEDEQSGEESETDIYTEADYIADMTASLLRDGLKRDGSKIRPRDIAVLMRSTKSSAAAVERALEKRGIPSFNNVSRAFFENAEVLLMYCLLAVIDNPQKDVCLAGVLRSPLYRVTLDELIYMRRPYPDGTLYDALCAFTEETGFAKGTYFLERLSYYRYVSEGMPVDRFLWMLYGDTGILSLVYEKEKHELFSEAIDSAQMRANLMMFYEYARSFERGGYQGLYQFVAFISSVIEEKAQMPPVLLSGEDADAVRIMTVHQSKGLEFPVCFVCGCGKRFNAADQRAAVLMDADGGIATYLGEESGFARINHPMRECVKEEIARKQKEEEMRVLYVALTRAREQLYVCGTHKAPRDYADSFTFSSVSEVTADDVMSQNTTLAWMLIAYSAGKSRTGLPVSLVFPTGADAVVMSDVPTSADNPTEDAIGYRAAKAAINDVLSFVYPDAHLTALPAKLSVSELLRLQSKAAVVPAAGEKSAEPREKEYAKPRFLQNDTDSGVSAAERGTATHQFMQFCDFGALSDTAVTPGARIDAEIERLLTGHFLSAETVSRIDRGALKRFLGSRLFRRLAYAKSVRREMRFNLFVPASELPGYDGADAGILVQGIIDCCYIDNDDRLVLIDYKTDHFSRADCENRLQVEKILSERYAGQLRYYRAAAEQLYCRPVSDVRIYSFALGDDFSVF